MRHVSIFIAAVVPLACAACGLFGPDTTTIQVQGQITAADNGSPIPDAQVQVSYERGCLSFSGVGCPSSLVIGVHTDTQGHYSLSFVHEGNCVERLFTLTAFQGVALEVIGFTDDPHIRCTEKLQTIDIQL